MKNMICIDDTFEFIQDGSSLGWDKVIPLNVLKSPHCALLAHDRLLLRVGITIIDVQRVAPA